jgi:transcriptional regulator with XRE-family HTH domain
VDVCLVIQQRLKELGLEQRDLAAAAQVTESYISQLLTRKKAPPATDRTDLYEKMNTFLKLPKGQLSAMAEAQRREEWKKKLDDPPAPLYKEVRELIIRKCHPEKQGQMRGIFDKQAFGELERLVTQKLLDVTKRIAKDELKNESWLRSVAKLRGRSYEEMRAIILEFLDTDVFNISIEHCSSFLNPMVESWDFDLNTFGMKIMLNRRLSSTQLVNFQFAEMQASGFSEAQPGFEEFLGIAGMSAGATEEEIEFLRSLRFRHNRPTALYYYRELQNLRDPLHFGEDSVGRLHKRRDANEAEELMQLDSRKRAIRRWATKKANPLKKRSPNGPSSSMRPRPGKRG